MFVQCCITNSEQRTKSDEVNASPFAAKTGAEEVEATADYSHAVVEMPEILSEEEVPKMFECFVCGYRWLLLCFSPIIVFETMTFNELHLQFAKSIDSLLL